MPINNYKGVAVKIDIDIGYERLYFWGGLFGRLILLPLFSLAPKNLGALIFRKSSKDADTVYQNVKTTRALEVMYGFGGKLKLTGTFLDGLFTYFWHHNIANAQAVRNRIRLVKKELRLAVENIYQQRSEPVKIFSIASGSARAVIEVMAELKHMDDTKSEFISIASHQLRTPLTSIKGWTSMINDGDLGKASANIYFF